jgi:signal transduction histidine kinase
MIVRDVVNNFGYVGAMVATREPDDSLPVRAYYLDPLVMSQDRIEKWERFFSIITMKKVGLKGPNSRAYLNDKRFQNNLSVRAIMAEGGPRVITHHELFSLFSPVVPRVLKGVVGRVQKSMGVRQVVAIPFFLNDQNVEEANVVGNLFVLAREEISRRDEKVFQSFGRMAAVAIENERRLQQEYWLNGQVKALQNTIYKMQTSLRDEQAILDSIVEGVVKNLGYVGAMVATRDEETNTLPVKAFFVDPEVMSEEEIRKWERRFSLIIGTEIGLTSPLARTYLNDEKFKENLSFRAIMASGGPQIVPDEELFSLFVPIVPEALRGATWKLQKRLGIGQVIAVPFFFEEGNRSDAQEVVGNLFVISKNDSFSPEEIELLKTFAQQAAIGIRNAQQYGWIQSLQADVTIALEEEKRRRLTIQALQREVATAYEVEKRLRAEAEQRRADAEKLNQMSILVANARHNLAGELDLLRNYVNRMLEDSKTDPLPPKVIKNLNKIKDRAEASRNLVQRLKEESAKLQAQQASTPSVDVPKKQAVLEPIELQARNIHDHLTKAIAAAYKLEKLDVTVVQDFCKEETLVWSNDELTEVFVILLNNAADELGEAAAKGAKNGDDKITIASQLIDGKWAVVTITDTGRGVPKEYRNKIFESEFTTKGTEGLGIGLFLAKSIVTRLCGEIWLAEENGATPGATFMVKLPLVTSKQAK